MELIWQANTPQWRSRTRAVRACPACHRRKLTQKRCRHLAPFSELAEDHTEPTLKARKPSVNTSASPNLTEHSPDPAAQRASLAGPNLQSFPGTGRFVGDLNPEAFIRERLDEPSSNPLRDRIGLWISSPTQGDRDHHLRSSRRTADHEASPAVPPSSTPNPQAVEKLLNRRYASAMQSCHRLPTRTREALTGIYFSKINHIIPLLEMSTCVNAQAEGSISMSLERSICLVAAKDIEAGPHLRLVEEGPIVSTRQFCTDIYNGLTVAMDAGLESDRLNRIRILSLMSLHCEGHEGAEAASLHLCQAIHQAQTIGLHLDRPLADAISEDPLTKLFWGLWTLDKVHASIGGRPVLLADRDIGIQKPNFRVSGAFGVWLAISDLLATVISYYRPSAGSISGWEEGFPAFEDIVGDDHGDLDFPTLGLLELYYHCVAILSCRDKLTEGHDGTKLSSIRQGLAAVRIQSIVASECSGQLPPLPIVPYAIALSMGVSYRQLRFSKLITHSNRAKASLEVCCSLLEDLSPQWSSAEAMARLGQKALQQFDQGSRQGPRILSAQGQETPVADPVKSFGDHDPAQANQDESGRSVGTDTDISQTSLPPISDFDTHGFSDIDTLFGEFLDLSLPTNFWDPIFAETDSESREV
ncbi:uncharacterized protein N7483_009067 [Penicillium malachiteum]|uniref:uncharacterized protein n=1 Tax=Penicillium malachiteum TaxID=1324776 RepID=UPI00254732DB|nr:uncharacterized protein N7483_009067 [Penicillium malachiteum]KAJ5721133.1 hypothetical protein N7483_009067 [Penicillium malachiteum]